MIKKLLVLFFVAILSSWASAALAASARDTGTQCYVWSNDPTPKLRVDYHPPIAYSFNAYGEAATYNTVSRTGTGTYRVTCKGAGRGGWRSAGGHVQVTAFGPTNNYCKVLNWSSGGADFLGNVSCYNAAGVPANSRFDLLFIW